MDRRLKLRAAIRELYARAREGEPTRDVFLRIKRIVKKGGLTMSEQVISEQNQNGTVEEVGALETETSKKRGGNRRNADNSTRRGGNRRNKANTNGVVPAQMVPLSTAQVCSLWRAAMGGELVIERTPDGGISCRVSFDSFEKALPVLLDQLQGGPK